MSTRDILQKLGQTISLTAAGIQDPSAPIRFLQFQQDQKRKAEAAEAMAAEKAKNNAFQDLMTAKILGVDVGSLQPGAGGIQPELGAIQAPSAVNQTIAAASPQTSTPQSFQNSIRPLPQPGGFTPTSFKAGGVNFGQSPAEAAQLDISKQVEGQREKDQVKTDQSLLNAELKMSNSFDAFLNVADRTMDLTGAKPGIVAGTFSHILGATKANDFVDGFKGSLIEVAAAVGAAAIPGARAVRLVNLFKDTGININQTIEGAIDTSMVSFKNALTSDMSKNPEAYIEGWELLSKEEQREQRKELSRIAKDFGDKYADTLLKQAYDKNPNLLKKETREKYEKQADDLAIFQEFNMNPDEFEIVR